MPTDDEMQPDEIEVLDAGSGGSGGPVDPADGLTDLLGGLTGASGDGGFDMGSLLQSAMEMQQQLLDAQAEAASAVVTGRSGGGAVEIEVTGGMEFRSVRIAAEAVDPDDVEMLQDLVLAALHDAVRAIADMQQSSMGQMPGLDALGLGGGDPFAALGGLGLDGDPDEDEDED